MIRTVYGPDLTADRVSPHVLVRVQLCPYSVKPAEKMVRDSVCHLSDPLTQIQVVCQFFLRGACKFGDECRNEHPLNGDRRSAFGGKSPVTLHCLGPSINQ